MAEQTVLGKVGDMFNNADARLREVRERRERELEEYNKQVYGDHFDTAKEVLEAEGIDGDRLSSAEKKVAGMTGGQMIAAAGLEGMHAFSDFAKDACRKFGSGVRDSVEDGVDDLQKAANDGVSKAREVVHSVAEDAADIKGKVLEKGKEAGRKAIMIGAIPFVATANGIRSGMDAAKGLFERGKDAAVSAFDAVREKASNTKQNVIEGVTVAGAKVRGAVEKVNEKFDQVDDFIEAKIVEGAMRHADRMEANRTQKHPEGSSKAAAQRAMSSGGPDMSYDSYQA